MSLRNVRQIFEDGDGLLSFGRTVSAIVVGIWIGLLALAAAKGGYGAAIDAFVKTAAPLAAVVSAVYGVSKVGDSVQGLRTPKPPKEGE